MTDRAPNDGETEPDYRFTLANERTFLGWIRTALALIAGGVALVQFVPSLGSPALVRVLAVALIAAGGVFSLLAVLRWNTVQRAMRRGEPLPRTVLPLSLSLAMAVLTVVVVVIVLTR